MKTWHTVIIQIKKYLYTRQRLEQMYGLRGGGRGICCWSRTSACLFSLRVCARLSVSRSRSLWSSVRCGLLWFRYNKLTFFWTLFHEVLRHRELKVSVCSTVRHSARLSTRPSVRLSVCVFVDLSVCYFSLFLLLFVLLRFVWGTVCKFVVERDNNLGKKRKQRNFMWFKGKRD